MEDVSVWGSVSAVDHRSVAALELMPLALSRYDTLKKKLETCGGVFGDQADHRAFFPWAHGQKKKRKKKMNNMNRFSAFWLRSKCSMCRHYMEVFASLWWCGVS